MSEDLLANISIASPCPADWNKMAGDDKARFCRQCRKAVYNISEMTQEEVVDLIYSTEGDFCGRLFRRRDGTVITKDCPVGLRLARRAWSGLTAALSLSAAFILGVFGITVTVLPNFVGSQGKIRVVCEKTDMHTMHLAVESFATDSAGIYPREAYEVLPYFPGGSNDPGGAGGVLPYNCALIDLDPSAFSRDGGRPELNPTVVQPQIASLDKETFWVGYCPLPDASGRRTSYAIIGGKGPHIARGNVGKELVLSNQ